MQFPGVPGGAPGNFPFMPPYYGALPGFCHKRACAANFATGFLDFTGFQEPPFFSPVFVLLYSSDPEFVPVSTGRIFPKPMISLVFLPSLATLILSTPQKRAYG